MGVEWSGIEHVMRLREHTMADAAFVQVRHIICIASLVENAVSMCKYGDAEKQKIYVPDQSLEFVSPHEHRIAQTCGLHRTQHTHEDTGMHVLTEMATHFQLQR